jgi:hypothetical protein
MLIHGLFAHARAFGEHAGANAIQTRELQDGHVRHAELVEAGGVEFRDDST